MKRLLIVYLVLLTSLLSSQNMNFSNLDIEEIYTKISLGENIDKQQYYVWNCYVLNEISDNSYNNLEVGKARWNNREAISIYKAVLTVNNSEINNIIKTLSKNDRILIIVKINNIQNDIISATPVFIRKSL